ncbi:TadE/TadG family type IV pilus assembly protein [Pelistega europaea]|nr:Tad domain-containing protein [Pelistega europaea]
MSGIYLRQGQVLVLGVAILSVLIVALLSMFHIGMLASIKTKQTHALDAAAYSGALVQARALNMQAYINIAQVGHQMAMAHLVTLASWADWASTMSKSVRGANPPAWVIATHFGARHGQAYTSAAKASILNGLANPGAALAQQFSRHDEIVEHVLAKVSYAIRDDMFEAREHAIHAVLQQNYPSKTIFYRGGNTDLEFIRQDRWEDVSVSAQQNHKQGSTATIQQYSGQGGLESQQLSWWLTDSGDKQFTHIFKPIANYRSLLNDVAAVYRFLGERKYISKSLLPVSERCPLWRHELRRQGSTLLNDKGQWQSIDTQSYHALRSNKWIGCYYREYPMGWGWVSGQSGKLPEGMAYATNPPGSFAAEDFWRWVQRVAKWNIFGGDDNPLANSRAVQHRHRWSGGGLVPYVDIDHTQFKKQLEFTLHLLQPKVRGQTFHLQTAAQTFFERPLPRVDGKREHPNLWHPYWQARLIALSKKEAK